MEALTNFYLHDRHWADCGLEPMRWCLAKWGEIGAPLYTELGCLCEVAKRIVMIFLLIIPTLVAFLMSLVILAMKQCDPVNHFTSREAIAKYHTIPGEGRTYTGVDCDLRSGKMLACDGKGQWFLWTPGPHGFIKVANPYSFPKNQTHKLNIGMEQARSLYRPLTADEVREKMQVNFQQFISAKYAPYLGVIVVRTQQGIQYSYPTIVNFVPLNGPTWIPTGGWISPGNADGVVVFEGEKLVDL